MTDTTHHRSANSRAWGFPWLQVLVVLSVIAAAVLAGAVLVQGYLIATGRGPSIATTSVTFQDLRDAHPLADGWRFAGISPDVDLPVAPTTPRMDVAAAYLATVLPPALLNVVALAMLMRVVIKPGITSDEILFSGATVDRLRRVGRFVITASVILIVYNIVTWNVLRGGLLPAGIEPASPSVMGVPLARSSLTLGIIVLGVAWIIQRGRLMREDLEGVI